MTGGDLTGLDDVSADSIYTRAMRTDGLITANAGIMLDDSMGVTDNTKFGLINGAYIEFDDQTTDEINFRNCYVGINEATPAAQFEIDPGSTYSKSLLIDWNARAAT